jgi:predicted PurR-regulated permease PerM
VTSIDPASNNNESKFLGKGASHVAIKILAWIAVGAVFYLGKPALAPLLFAVVLAMLLSPLVDFLERHHVPRTLASVLSVCILIASIGVIIDAAWNPTLKWMNDAPTVLQKIEQKIRPLQRVIARIDSVTTRASSLTTAARPTNSGAMPVANTDDSISRMDALSTTRAVLIDAATISILTVFLLVGGARSLRSIEGVFVSDSYSYQYLRIVGAVRDELSRYFATLTLINVCLGIVTTGVMALWGLPSPWLWGSMAAVLNFIPYIGPAITLFVLTVVSLVIFNGYAAAIGVAGSFLMLTTIEGQIVQPLLVGYRLNLNPIVLFISIWLAGWFWGVAGIVLATPVLIALKEIANRQTRPSVLKAVLNSSVAIASKTEKGALDDLPV